MKSYPPGRGFIQNIRRKVYLSCKRRLKEEAAHQATFSVTLVMGMDIVLALLTVSIRDRREAVHPIGGIPNQEDLRVKVVKAEAKAKAKSMAKGAAAMAKAKEVEHKMERRERATSLTLKATVAKVTTVISSTTAREMEMAKVAGLKELLLL